MSERGTTNSSIGVVIEKAKAIARDISDLRIVTSTYHDRWAYAGGKNINQYVIMPNEGDMMDFWATAHPELNRSARQVDCRPVTRDNPFQADTCTVGDDGWGQMALLFDNHKKDYDTRFSPDYAYWRFAVRFENLGRIAVLEVPTQQNLLTSN